jgi:glycosyltransferase involved in cell wall biosynthesis
LRVLYLIDPNSIHDQKWIRNFVQNGKNDCYFICRLHHFSERNIKSFEKEFNIKCAGTIDYFSYTKIFGSTRQILKIKKIIRKHKIQLFHIQFAEPNALWTLFRYFLAIPIIITCRGTDVLKTIPDHFSKKDSFNKLISWSYKKAFQRADWVTVTSLSQMNSVKGFSGRRDKISIIRTGVELERLYLDTSSFFPNEVKKSFILFPRFIKRIYNHEFAIEAIKALPLEIKNKFLMVFVGKDEGDINYQKQLIRLLDEDEQIDYLILPKQQQEGIWELYKRAEVIIMTPKSDGSPVSGMEAIALGKKLIVGPLSYDEDIFNYNTCTKLKKWDSNELATQIVKALVSEFEQTVVEKEKIDFNENMEKMASIYLKVVFCN